jgi:hypothetical protein
MWTEYEPWSNQIEECETDSRRTEYRNLFGGKDLKSNKWILHHDNAPAHDVLSVHEFLAKKSIIKMHPPYLFDIAPCSFWFFPKL